MTLRHVNYSQGFRHFRAILLAFLDKMAPLADTRAVPDCESGENYFLKSTGKGKNMERALQAGFTLIELVVVIVILGILAAVAVPQFTNLTASAYSAVEQAACGAVQSQAVLSFASNKGPTAAINIETAVNTSSSGVTVTSAPGCTFTAKATGNAGQTTCFGGAALPTQFCP